MGRLLFLRWLPLFPVASGFRAPLLADGQDNSGHGRAGGRWGVGGSITEQRTHGSIPEQWQASITTLLCGWKRAIGV